MLLHVAAVSMLVNIAFVEYESFRSPMDPSSIETPLHRVFVYGTLKRGEPNYPYMKETTNGYAKFCGIGRTTVAYPLVIASKYNIPFLLKKPNTGNFVFGEIYDVDSKMLNSLDVLEEHPILYERTQEEVSLAPENELRRGQTFQEVGVLTKAWIYFLSKYNVRLLEGPMYTSYSNNGSHGQKYCENDNEGVSLNDVLEHST